MTNPAIDRLKNRERKKVTTRNASLNQNTINKVDVDVESNNNDSVAQTSNSSTESNNNDSVAQTSNSSTESNNNDSVAQTSNSLTESNNNDSVAQTSNSSIESNNNDSVVQTSNSSIESNNNDSVAQTGNFSFSIDSEPVRRTIRLDPEVDEYMDTLCKTNKVTKETLFEAAILVCSGNQKTLKKVIANAQDRYRNRKRVGEIKKLRTMNRKFQDR